MCISAVSSRDRGMSCHAHSDRAYSVLRPTSPSWLAGQDTLLVWRLFDRDKLELGKLPALGMAAEPESSIAAAERYCPVTRWRILIGTLDPMGMPAPARRLTGSRRQRFAPDTVEVLFELRPKRVRDGARAVVKTSDEGELSIMQCKRKNVS